MRNKKANKDLKVVSDKKLLKKLKSVKKIELASTSGIDKYEKEISVILKILGHPESLVTDESIVWDFLSHFGDKKENEKYNKKMVSKISGRLGIEIKPNDLLINIAKKIREY